MVGAKLLTGKGPDEHAAASDSSSSTTPSQQQQQQQQQQQRGGNKRSKKKRGKKRDKGTSESRRLGIPQQQQQQEEKEEENEEEYEEEVGENERRRRLRYMGHQAGKPVEYAPDTDSKSRVLSWAAFLHRELGRKRVFSNVTKAALKAVEPRLARFGYSALRPGERTYAAIGDAETDVFAPWSVKPN